MVKRRQVAAATPSPVSTAQCDEGTNQKTSMRRSSSSTNDVSQKKTQKQCTRLLTCQTVKKGIFTLTYDDGSKYVGEVQDHGTQKHRHGKGVFQTKHGDVMDGQWKDDRFHGFGTRDFAQTRDRHEGMYYKDKRHGRGTYLWTNGDKYVGEFYNGRMHGAGIFLSANGDVFEGTWAKGVVVHGTKTLANGDTIQGVDGASAWVDGLLTGDGIKRFRNGDTYHGHFDANVLSGYGVYCWTHGDVYHGLWQCNQMHGIGRFDAAATSASSRDVYYGEFVKGQYHGQGRLEYASGAVYEGTFERHLRHGRGVYRWVDGDMYEGTWSKNLPSGMGFHVCEAFTYHGAWQDGWPHGVGLFRPRDDEAAASTSIRRHTFEYGRTQDDHALVLDQLCIV
ncbi:Aste57867_18854 [Aphanomyces stellatus]|uniref:Aste57867_18854 protein n=1 Tax=Aphanomyces stellatus TaxID=120398 RepID=A0A485LC15_9STRA|nr:hypothetical protein As57867_018790 [Aphanomyces stellatus]VFT95588.1 Aste57867_18854 [Aphanomyces stellatus]